MIKQLLGKYVSRKHIFGSPQHEQERALALAGVYQASALVKHIAQEGSAPQPPLRTSIRSVLVLDANSVHDIFSPEALRLGFKTLLRQLEHGTRNADAQITGYMSAIIVLERSLAKHPARLAAIREGVIEANKHVDEDGLLGVHVIEVLAHTYSTQISPLSPRIMVKGDPAYLKQLRNANLIRALLLAAIRATVLWRQLGGSRRRLLFTCPHVLELAATALERET